MITEPALNYIADEQRNIPCMITEPALKYIADEQRNISLG